MSNLRQIVDVEPPAGLSTTIVLLAEMDYKEREHWFEAIDGYGVGLPFDSAQIALSNHEHGAVTGSVSVEVFDSVSQAATFYQAFPVEIALELGEHASLMVITTDAAQNLIYVVQRCRAVVIGQFHIAEQSNSAAIQADIEAYLSRLDTQLAVAYCGDLPEPPPIPIHSSLEKPAWEIELPIKTYPSAVADPDGGVFYHVLYGKIHALNAQTGQLLWTHQVEGSKFLDVNIIDLQGTWLYCWLSKSFGQECKSLYVFDVKTQTVVATIDDIERRPLAIHEKMIYATLSDKKTLVVRDLAAGNERWRHTFDTKLDHLELVSDASVLLVLSGQTIWAFDATTGGILWQRELAGYVWFWSSGIDLLYVRVGTSQEWQDRTVALDIKNGSELFQIDQPTRLIGSLLYNNAHLTFIQGYAPHELYHKLRAFDPLTGQELWSAPIRGAYKSQVYEAQGMSVVFHGNSAITGIDKSTGNIKWKYRLPNMFNSMFVSAGMIYGDICYVIAENGLYALLLETGELIKSWVPNTEIEIYQRVWGKTMLYLGFREKHRGFLINSMSRILGFHVG